MSLLWKFSWKYAYLMENYMRGKAEEKKIQKGDKDLASEMLINCTREQKIRKKALFFLRGSWYCD